MRREHSRPQQSKCELCIVVAGIASIFMAFCITILFMTGSFERISIAGCGAKSGTSTLNLPERVYSPAQTIQKFQAVEFDGNVDARNIYKGNPGSGLDNAWRQLHDVEPLLVTSAELQKIQKSSVELPSRPGFHLAKLAVFHQLHCLDKVRQYVHNDYYKLTDDGQSVSVIDHVDHCIDIIRQALMCQADTALITFDRNGPFKPIEPNFSATHVCNNFDLVHDWAKDREVNITDEAIQNPEPFKQALIDELDKKLAGHSQ